MSTNFKSATITDISGGWVDGTEASSSFTITGTASYVGTAVPPGTQFSVLLTFTDTSGHTFTETVLADTTPGSGKTFSWTATVTDLAQSTLVSGLDSVTATFTSLGQTPVTSATTLFDYIVCFARGTRLATTSGEIAVENLELGDLLLTVSGHPSPIKWIGHRRINVRAYEQAERAAPVRIRRGAFADNVPHRDLLVSPDHAIFTNDVLICARQLINGATITQDLDCDSVEYFHVELASHDILLAEGLPAESYLDTGNRGFFINGADPVVLQPNLMDAEDQSARAAGSCAPLVTDEADVRPVWQHIADRATTLGWSVPTPDTVTDPALRVVANGRTIQPVCSDAGLFTFVLPQGVREVRLVSRFGTPTDTRPWLEDRRRLGVRVAGIVVRDASEMHILPVDHPELSNGWWDVEHDERAMRRWTNGNALLPLPETKGATILEIRVADTLQYVAMVPVTDYDKALLVA